MAVCLDYQAVYCERPRVSHSWICAVLASLVLFIALACKVSIKVHTTDSGYELASLQEQMVALDMQRREYELQLSVILRPDNLEQAAATRLGLNKLKPSQARRIVAGS